MQLRQAVVVGALWVLGYALAIVLVTGNDHAQLLLGDVVYLVPVVVAVALTTRAALRLRGGQRVVWGLLALSSGLLLAGEVTWSFIEVVLGQEVPSPGLSDLFYLAAYVPVPFAIARAFGRAPALRRARALLDASLVAAAVAMLGWRLLIAPQLEGGLSATTATSIAYPLADIAILVVLLSLGFAGHRGVPASVALVGASYGVGALGDVAFTWLTVAQGYETGSWAEVCWQSQVVLLCLAAVAALRPGEREAEVTLLGRDLGLGPTLVGAICAAALVIVDIGRGRLSTATATLALLVFACLVARQWLTARDKNQVARDLDVALREQERLAVTDGLTGLYNRRFFEEVLHIETERAALERQPFSVLVLDLDHFKRVNDTHGHDAGDQVLRTVAERIPRAVRPSDVVARYGGEEFVVLLPGADATTLEEVAERVRLAVAAEPFELAGPPRLRLRVTASLGGATHPTHAALADELIRTADRALYAAKARGRDRVCIGDLHDRAALLAADTGLVTVLERLADLVDWRQGPDEHSSAVARWAGVVADALGMSAQRRQSLQLAARLHDIGKLALPDAVLGKADPLDEDEWAMMRTHAAEGAGLLEGLPGMEEVTPLVRAHHERQDGRGYPDGLRAADLPVEVGIIAVCDAWAAMRAQRVYGPRRSREDARSDLEAGRGTQFDAEVVDLFLALEAAGVVGFVESSGLDKVPRR